MKKQVLTFAENTDTINKPIAKKVISNSFFTEESIFLEKNVKKYLTGEVGFAILNKSSRWWYKAARKKDQLIYNWLKAWTLIIKQYYESLRKFFEKIFENSFYEKRPKTVTDGTAKSCSDREERKQGRPAEAQTYIESLILAQDERWRRA